MYDSVCVYVCVCVGYIRILLCVNIYNHFSSVGILYHQGLNTRKITRSLENIKLKIINSVPSSITKLAWIITSIYIYIYIYSLKKKPKTGYFRIINLIKRGGNSSPLFLSPPPCLFCFILSIRSEEVLLYFSSCFWFTSETQNRMEINL